MSSEHQLYTAEDFTPYETAARNIIYVLVVEEGMRACKQCGAKDAKLDEFPTCREYDKYQEYQRHGSRKPYAG